MVSNFQPYSYINYSVESATVKLDDEQPVFVVEDSRPITDRIFSITLAVLKQAYWVYDYALRIKTHFKPKAEVYLEPTYQENSWVYEESNLPWVKHQTSESEGLVLCVHGLRAHPSTWEGYISELSENYPGAHIIAPYVAEKGNCPLEVCAQPLLELVRNYAAKYPGAPITLIGTSNGARILSYIENHLSVEEMEGRKLNVVSIAGLHYGTKFIDNLEKYKVDTISGLDSAFAEEAKWQSKFATNLLREWSDKQAVWAEHEIAVRHMFYASHEDEMINRSSTMPHLANVNHPPEYYVVSGETHKTIVPAVQRHVVQRLLHHSRNQ